MLSAEILCSGIVLHTSGAAALSPFNIYEDTYCCPWIVLQVLLKAPSSTRGKDGDSRSTYKTE